MDPDNLQRMIADDEFGLLELPAKRVPISSEDRLAAGFQEVTDFVTEQGREPKRNPSDIAETKLAMRLEAIIGNDEQRGALEPFDELGLLKEPAPPASIEEALAADDAGLLDGGVDLFELNHVPKRQTMPERIARRKPCPDFDQYKPLFTDCQAELHNGTRKLLKFSNPQDIREGAFLVLNGILLYVDHIGVRKQDEIGKANARTRCIFENGTESDLLLQSLASNLYKDGQRVTEPAGPILEAMETTPNTPMGVVYVLQSLSDDERLLGFHDLHKIGSTARTVKQRTAGAANYGTFLNAQVEVLAEYQVPAGIEQKIEALLHRVFATARLDIWFERDGITVTEANEWFAVPLKVIDEAIELIQSEAITNYEYDRDEQRLRLRSEP